ncbi:hypothetical protein CVIRNUC_001155 [Coccomyxa viridis]|uniref:ATP-dependent (S)-NAD(P)H-hydrate dehydratase n=1 Tax=Coccomyxa viridis TaxID=1274662 RepID=A0AAV1HWP7_9CHLO|nr:hypothetical protein CVIRNUC_001155 [Coccomyxa viridis]
MLALHLPGFVVTACTLSKRLLVPTRREALSSLAIKSIFGQKLQAGAQAVMAGAREHPDRRKLEDAIQQIIPELTPEKYKGQAGKIGTIGGCREYTGAPFFASFSALKVGADLSHVFCTEGAATVIKSYSPELIVHPYLPDSNDVVVEIHGEEVAHRDAVWRAVGATHHWMDRFDVVVIGPGLGRDKLVHETVIQVMKFLRKVEKPLVIDADGLYIVTKNLDLVKGYPHAILTPNKNEYERLADQLGIDIEQEGALEKIVKALDGPTVVRKGTVDTICDGHTTLVCDEPGSNRRAGGQGDVLSGSTAAFLSWALQYGQEKGIGQDASKYPLGLSPYVLAAWGACTIARNAAARAYEKKGRSMLALDVIEELGGSVDWLDQA